MNLLSSLLITLFSIFSQPNEVCTDLPVLTYHHVEEIRFATKHNRVGLAVSPESFKKHLTHLKHNSYTSVFTDSLITFFNHHTPLTSKAIILSFDDGYSDFYTTVYPLLQDFNFKAVVFLPTGLVDTPGYLTWTQVTEMQNSGLVEFANHTWSHRSLKSIPSVIDEEITIADIQLQNHAINPFKSFAYPYGEYSLYSIDFLKQLNYQLAFTTKYGRTMCSQNRYTLPRIRVGNFPLSQYGL